jgi:hypothetical protein
MVVKVIAKTLSDKSVVYDVILVRDDDIFVLPAYEEKDAQAMCAKITEAIDAHSTELVYERRVA